MVSEGHCLHPARHTCLSVGEIICAVIVAGMISLQSMAQEEAEACPCFSYEEVEVMFLQAEQLETAQGTSDCMAEDYGVSCSAEIIVWDQNYAVIAQARVDWWDFDPGSCIFIDTGADPGVQRKITWPHPAPESVARACFDIITGVIETSDTTGRCFVSPECKVCAFESEFNSPARPAPAPHSWVTRTGACRWRR